MANSFFIEQNADALPLYRLPIQWNATSYFLQELYVIILGLKNEQDVEQKSEIGVPGMVWYQCGTNGTHFDFDFGSTSGTLTLLLP